MNRAQLQQNLKIATGLEKPENGRTIREVLADLDGLSRDATVSRDLAHYLSRRSYLKALEWLEHPDMPHKP
ncbi:MAG: hypothetical protein ACNA77_06485 [Opitutales bacterium]